MRNLFYILMAYGWLIAAIVAVINKDFTRAFAYLALAWCNKLESDK